MAAVGYINTSIAGLIFSKQLFEAPDWAKNNNNNNNFISVSMYLTWYKLMGDTKKNKKSSTLIISNQDFNLLQLQYAYLPTVEHVLVRLSYFILF